MKKKSTMARCLFSKTVYFEMVIFFILITVLTGCSSGGGGGSDSDDPATFTVSGTLLTEAGNGVDSDTNDPSAPFQENDSFTSAQDIESPVILGGYVNMPGAGAAGRSLTGGDTVDYYEVTLNGNEKIRLTLPDDAEGVVDVELSLYNNIFTLQDTIIDIDKTGLLTVSAAGTYYIKVEAKSLIQNSEEVSATTYKLYVGLNDTLAQSSGGLRLGSEFVPGEAIVKFKEETLNKNSVLSSTSLQAKGVGIKQGKGSQVALVSFKNLLQKEQMFSTLSISLPDQKKNFFPPNEKGMRDQEKYDTLTIIKTLRNQSDVVYAEPNYIRRRNATPSDEYYPLQWSLPMLNLPKAWDITKGSSSVIVAVIDTGVLLSHPDLSANLIAGYDFISSTSRSRDGNGIDNNPDDPGDSINGTSSFHGTHVAGIISAAASETPGAAGMAGVSWNTQIMPIRVLGYGGGTDYDVAQGIRYAARLSNDSLGLPTTRADIINMSLGGNSDSTVLRDAVAAAATAGVIIVAAAGNDGLNINSYPAAYPNVISVASVDINSERASYSNFSSTVDIAAPGGDVQYDFNNDGYGDGVLSTVGDDSGNSITSTYSFYEGTSMATPHVAGVIALMKAVDPGLTASSFDTLLQNGALTTDLGDAGRDNNFGYGLIDAYKSVLAAQGSGSGVAYLAVRPKVIQFAADVSTMDIFAEKIGADALDISSATSSASWLTVATKSVDSNNLGSYSLTVDRSGLSGGIHTTIIDFTTTQTGKSIEIPVYMEVMPDTGANVGYHYILLINTATNATTARVDTLLTNGSYNFSFSGIPTGNYVVMAGTDLDYDRSIGDGGEAVGITSIFSVQGDTSNISLTTGFSQNLFTFFR